MSSNGTSDGPVKARRVDLADIPTRLATRLMRSHSECNAQPRTAGRGRVVAVLHRGEIVLGTAGPRIEAVQVAVPDPFTT